MLPAGLPHLGRHAGRHAGHVLRHAGHVLRARPVLLRARPLLRLACGAAKHYGSGFRRLGQPKMLRASLLLHLPSAKGQLCQARC